MKKISVIIVGAGASGLVNAIMHARDGADVTVLEQSKTIAKKILASGNGQCNITNKHITPSRFHSANHNFIEQVLEDYPYETIEKFFTSIGLTLVEGKEGKMFPMSMQASTVVELLEYEAKDLGVSIVCDCVVISINKEYDIFSVRTSCGEKICQKLILASGSSAAPQLGGSSSGHDLASKLGHSLVPLHPSLVQLCSDSKWLQQTAGVKVPGIAKLYANGEFITEKRGDLLFTNYGISGLAILDISREASIKLANTYYCELHLDIMPELNKERLTNLLLGRVQKESTKPIDLWLQGVMNKKLAKVVQEESGIKANAENQLNRKEINKLVHSIKNLKLVINDTKGFKSAETSTGGVNTLEVNPANMESQIVPQLFFAGEVLDVDGDRGGFSFHFAWVCGLRAGLV